MSDGAIAVAQLAQADLTQLRLTGAIFAVLIERGLLDRGQVRSIVTDAMAFLPSDHPMRMGYQGLIDEFS